MSTSPAPRAAAPARRSRSGALPQLPANLAHLRHVRRWVCWRSGQPKPNGKRPKQPHNPLTGKGADTTDSSTWGTWDECIARMKQWPGFFEGIGIMLLDGEIGIDKDGCVRDGVLTPEAAQMVAALTGKAYLEISVNGGGVHGILFGSIPDSFKTDDLEMYRGADGRYLTVSGNELDGSAAPGHAQDVLDALYAQYAPQDKQPHQKTAFALAPTLALTPELDGAIQQAQQRLGELLTTLYRAGMTAQLKALLERGEFPPHMKQTTDSDARAVIVYQLDRSPAKFSDAEIIVLAEYLIRKHGYTGRFVDDLRVDVRRLLTRSRAGRQGVSTAAPAKPTRQPMMDRITYMQMLAAEALINDTILLNQAQRATAARVPLGTAKKLDAEIVAAGWVERFTYALRGEGVKGRSGGLRLTDAGRAVLYPVIFSQNSPVSELERAVDPVKEAAPAAEKSSNEEDINTVLCDIAPVAVAARREHTHTTTPCSNPMTVAGGAGVVTRADMLSLAARVYGEDWQAARSWARREYPQHFESPADYGRFKSDYQQELGARAEAVDDRDARVAVESGDARALRATGQYLLFDQTGVHDYASQWNQPVPSPIVPQPTAKGGGGERSASGSAAASAAGKATESQSNPLSVVPTHYVLIRDPRVQRERAQLLAEIRRLEPIAAVDYARCSNFDLQRRIRVLKGQGVTP